MKDPKNEFSTIDEYIKLFPNDVQERLQQLREAIKEVIPDAEEVISYKMPAFKVHGHIVVYFAGFKKHIGFYPFPSGVEAFEKETSAYPKSGKGTIQFPLDRPIPFDIVKKVVLFRVKENLR